jgi:hypothetical protein
MHSTNDINKPLNDSRLLFIRNVIRQLTYSPTGLSASQKSHDTHSLIPASYIFSYWIVIWAAIYIAIKYAFLFSNTELPKQIKWFNPSLVLLVVIIWVFESLLAMVLSGMPVNVSLKQFIVMITIKAIPLWLVWTWDIKLYRDVTITIILFAIYCWYLWLNGTDVFEVYVDLQKSIENDENRTPLEHLLFYYSSQII